MFLVMPASFSFLSFFLSFLILVYLTCSSGLSFCFIPISSFSVPYFSHCIPSSFPAQSSSLLSLPSEGLQTIPPSHCFLSLSCDILFGIFSFSQTMNLDSYSLPLALHVFRLIILLTHGIAFIFLSHTNILSSATFCLTKTFIYKITFPFYQDPSCSIYCYLSNKELCS